MSDELTNDPRGPIWFQFSGHKDTPGDIAENINSFGGKSLLLALKSRLWDQPLSKSTERYDSEVFAEDWGWCVFLRHEGALIMLGTHVLSGDLSDDEAYSDYVSADWIECGLSVEHFHRRSLGDLLRGRNKADPDIRTRAFESIWKELSRLAYIRALSLEQP